MLAERSAGASNAINGRICLPARLGGAEYRSRSCIASFLVGLGAVAPRLVPIYDVRDALASPEVSPYLERALGTGSFNPRNTPLRFEFLTQRRVPHA